MYYKGANMLHTIRQLVNDDEKWREILRGLNKEYYHQTVTTKQIEDYISINSGLNLKSVFDQYLRDVRIPIFEYGIINNQMMYHWRNCNDAFNMSVKLIINGKPQWFNPSTEWKIFNLSDSKSDIVVDPEFYVASLMLIKK